MNSGVLWLIREAFRVNFHFGDFFVAHKDEHLIRPSKALEDTDLDLSLRPSRFDEFVGQAKILNNLKVFIEATRMRGDALDHVLLSGPPGLGKTTLSHIIAHELGVQIRITSGPVLDKAGDLAGILTNLEEKDVLFIDEIHRLNPIVEEYLYSAMEDFQLDIVIDKGPSARTIQLALPHFTLIGATTRAGLITAPLRGRFGITARLDYYNDEDLTKIVTRSADILQVSIDAGGSSEIAKRSRGTPRISNRLLKRARDFAMVRGQDTINKDIADFALKALEVDEHGLDEMDKRILIAIIEKFGGGPVGLDTIAISVGEEPGTIEEVYEPFLIQKGFLKRTPRGREVTQLAYEHLRLKPRRHSKQTGLEI